MRVQVTHISIGQEHVLALLGTGSEIGGSLYSWGCGLKGSLENEHATLRHCTSSGSTHPDENDYSIAAIYCYIVVLKFQKFAENMILECNH
eukprot:2984762-Amphidinium_carterae.1